MSENSDAFNKVIFFRSFDLADFFESKVENNNSFLNIRTDKNLHKLFRYKPDEDVSLDRKCLQEIFETKERISGQDESTDEDANSDQCSDSREPLSFKFSGNDKNLDYQAYRIGIVRTNLFELCIFPRYIYQNEPNDLLQAPGNNSDLNTGIFERYKKKLESWQNEDNQSNKLVIKLCISSLGIVSVFLEWNDARFTEPKNEISCNETLVKIKNRLKSLIYPRVDDDSQDDFNEPSLINFIAIMVVFHFLYEIKKFQSINQQRLERCTIEGNVTRGENLERAYHWLSEWFKNVGQIKDFKIFWEQCNSTKLPLRHVLSFFFFQSEQYSKSLTEYKGFRDNVYNLALYASYQYPEGERFIFSPTIEHYKKNELCVTSNGTAQMKGSSLVVAVKNADYCVGGEKINEEFYWKEVFFIFCYLREYLLLCDRCLRDLHDIRDHYEKLQKKISKSPLELSGLITWGERRKIQSDLSQLSNLLFDIDEGINRITYSRIVFVQEKIKNISMDMGLVDLMENVTISRRNLENRVQETNTLWNQKISLMLSTIAILISTGLLILKVFP